MKKINWKSIIGWGIAAVFVIGIIGGNMYQQSTDNSNKIIGFLPLTGRMASAGIEEGHGIELAIDKWNNRGGLLGKKLDVTLEDTRSDPTTALTIFQRNSVGNYKPLAIYSMISAVALNLKNFTEKDGITHIGAIGAVNFTNEPNKHLLRDFASPVIIGKALIKHVKEKYPNKRMVYFYENSDNSIDCTAAIKEEITPDFKVKMLDFDPTMYNFRDLILKAGVDNEKDIVVVMGMGSYLGILIRQLREYDYKGPILGDVNITIGGVVEYAGDAMKNVIVLDYTRNPDSPLCEEVKKAYFQKYQKEIPDNIAPYLAYQGIDTLLAFYESKGTTDIPNLREAMEGFEHDGCLGKITVKNGEINYPLSFRTVKE